MISVNSSGSSNAGEMLTLMCFVTRIANDIGNVLLQWLGPGGNQVASMGAVVVGSPLTSGAVTSLSLQFTTLFTSHGGEYTCQGVFSTHKLHYSIS